MKIALSLLSSVCICGTGFCQTAFQNLDFESANVPDLPAGEYRFPESFNDAFPGWTGYFGTNLATQVAHNTVSLGAYNISILGPTGPFLEALQGNYSAELQAGLTFNGQGPALAATIAQIGLVPSDARSIQMLVSPDLPEEINGLLVTLGGHNILMSRSHGTDLFVGDISAMAGQAEELRISALPLPTDFNTSLELDSITFSPQVVPEPANLSLVLLAGFLVSNLSKEKRL